MLATFLTTKKSKCTHAQAGVTLVEMILYVVLLVFVMSIIVQMLVSIGGVYRSIKITREIESSGAIAMEQMLREIRNASMVEITGSVLGTSLGALTISGTDESSNPYKTNFSVNSGVLQISKNDGVPVSLTSSPVVVSYLLFNRVATSTSEGVRVEMEVTGVGPVSRSERFYGFTVIRGSY